MERSPALTLDDSGGQRVNLTKGTFCKVGPTMRTGTHFPMGSGMPLRQPRRITVNAVQDGVRTSVRVQRALAGRVSPRRRGTFAYPQSAADCQGTALRLAAIVLRSSFGSFGRSAVSTKTGSAAQSSFVGFRRSAVSDKTAAPAGCAIPSARSSFRSFGKPAVSTKTAVTTGCGVPSAARSSLSSFCQLAKI